MRIPTAIAKGKPAGGESPARKPAPDDFAITTVAELGKMVGLILAFPVAFLVFWSTFRILNRSFTMAFWTSIVSWPIAMILSAGLTKRFRFRFRHDPRGVEILRCFKFRSVDCVECVRPLALRPAMKSALFIFAIFLGLSPALALADADDVAATGPGAPPLATLDYRSKYYQDWFPETFRVEDTTIDNELRFDWEHDEAKGSTTNIITGEVEKSFGIFTFEVQAPYVANTGGGGDSDDGADQGGDPRGIGSIELAGRLPLLESVSSSGFFDNTIGFNLEAGIPTNSAVGKNAELSPGIFDDLAIGDRFSIQTLFSFSHLYGSLDSGRDTFEYGLAFGYAIEDEDFRIPHIERLIPIVELVGETSLAGSNAGHDDLTGTAGLRAELKPIGGIQPSFGVGYLFPIDKGGREDLRWGLVTSLTFEM
jgi:hypothetical protein